MGELQLRELIIMVPESGWYLGNSIRLTNGVYVVVEDYGFSMGVSCESWIWKGWQNGKNHSAKGYRLLLLVRPYTANGGLPETVTAWKKLKALFHLAGTGRSL
jgi:hypothetical protein